MDNTDSSAYATRSATLRQRLAARLLRSAGWYIEPFPQVDKAIVVGGPHTSNWDGVIGLIAAIALGVNAQFLIKHTAFRGPLGPLLRKLGGVPVDRRRAGGVVRQAAAAFEREQPMLLVVTPEGTRSRAERWKTGFHHIALAARVPIVLATLDYGQKRLTFPLIMQPGDDLQADMQQMYQQFAEVTPRHPSRLSRPVQALRKEG